MSYENITNAQESVNKDRITIQRGKHDKEHPYVMISKKMLRDKNLSPKSKGILCYFLSLPDDWKTHLRQIADALDVSKDQIYTAMDELIKFGYVVKTVLPRDHGKFSGILYEFFEEPQTPTVPGIPDAVSSDSVKPTLLKKEKKEDRGKEYNPSLEVPKEPPPDGEKRAHGDAPFSENVKEVAKAMVEIISKHNPVYRAPKDMKKFYYAVETIIVHDAQDVDTVLKTFEWGVADNIERGDFKGWQGIICSNSKGGKATNPAEIFKKHFAKIHAQMKSRPVRKFCASHDEEVGMAAWAEMNKRAL